MSRPSPLLVAASTVAVLAAGALTGPAAPGQAAEAGQDLTFAGCDLYVGGDLTSTTVDFATTVDLAYPGLVRAGQSHPLSMSLGTVPGGAFPEDLADATVGVELAFAGGAPKAVAERPLGTFDADAALSLADLEVAYALQSSGRYDFRPTTLLYYVHGDPGDGQGPRYYEYLCDAVVDPPSLMAVGVHDPTRPADIFTDTLSATQGDTLPVRGFDFAREDPHDPDLDVVVTIGGTVVGRFDVDEIGSFSGTVRVPEFVAPRLNGAVRASFAGERTDTNLTIYAKRGTVAVSPDSVRSGGRITVRSSGYKPGEQVNVRLVKDRVRAGMTSRYAFRATAKANAAGVAKARISVPGAGRGTWKAEARGEESKRFDRAAFRIT